MGYNKRFLVSLTDEQFEKIKWLSYQSSSSKSDVLRQLIDKETDISEHPDKLDALKATKIADMNQLQAKIKELEDKKLASKIAEPVKKEKYESLWEDAVNLTIRAIPNNKENVVADGNATYIRSFGFKVTTKDILNEAYKRKGLMHKIEQTVKED